MMQVGMAEEEETPPLPYDQLGEAMKARHGELVKRGSVAKMP